MLSRILVTLPGLILIIGLAAAVTGVTLYRPSLKPGPADQKIKSAPAVVTPTPTPLPSPSASPAVRRAVVTSQVNLRAAKSTTSAVLADLKGGETVTIGTDHDDFWQAVEYKSIKGYIARTYLNYQ